MSNVNKILSRLASTRKVEVNIKSSKVLLSKIDDLTTNINNAAGDVFDIRNEVITVQGYLETYLAEMESAIGIIKKYEADVADIEAQIVEIGLDVPQVLQDALDNIDAVANSGAEITLQEAISALQSFRNQLQGLG